MINNYYFCVCVKKKITVVSLIFVDHQFSRILLFSLSMKLNVH